MIIQSPIPFSTETKGVIKLFVAVTSDWSGYNVYVRACAGSRKKERKPNLILMSY